MARLIVCAALAAGVLGSASPAVAQAPGAPGLAITTSGPVDAVAGELLTYALRVTNTGTTAFGADTLLVTVAQCQAPPVLVSTGDDVSPATLDPGESWAFQCQVQTAAGQTSVRATGEVTGGDAAGRVLTASGSFTTALGQPAGAVSPSAVVSGLGRLTGTVGCAASRYAVASVSGRQIRRVVFFVNGRRARTLATPNAGASYRLRLATRSLRYGTYRVGALITFVPQAQTQPTTLTLQFSRCRPRLVRPTFAG